MSAISGANSLFQILSSNLSGGQPFSSSSLSTASSSELASLGSNELALQQSQDFFLPSSDSAASTPLSSLDPASLAQSYANLASGYDSYARANPSGLAPDPGSLLSVLG